MLQTKDAASTFHEVTVTWEDGRLVYFHGDHLGSAMSDEEGQRVPGSVTHYLPFGDWREEPTAGISDRGYTGHRHNNLSGNDLGLVYMNARYYNAGIGRFISADTLVSNPTNPQSFNRYSYVNNNPLKYVDPSGHCRKGPDGACLSEAPPADPTPEQNDDLINYTGEEWTDADKAIINSAAHDVAVQFAKAVNERRRIKSKTLGIPYVPITPKEAFIAVYGGQVTFDKTGQSCQEALNVEGCYGSTAGTTISVYTDSDGDINGMWAIHEMGHAFENRVNGTEGAGSPRGLLGADTSITRRGTDNDIEQYGFAGTRYGWQQSPEDTPGEEFADMFIGWTYDRWESGTDRLGLSAQGFARRRFMQRNMGSWINLIVDN